jgi:histidine triad (HIT) family protein
MEDCLFCKIVKGEIPSTKVYEDENYYAFRDIPPAAPVHVLVVPKRHAADAAEGAAVPGLMEGLMAAAVKIAAAEGLAAGGYRLVVNSGPDAGQSVGHLHLHILGGRPMAWPPG